MERAFAGDAKVVKSSGKEVSAREDSVLHTASVSPLDRDKDIVLDPRKMLAHFSVLNLLLRKPSYKKKTKSEPLRNAKSVKSLGKERSARGEEPLFKAVFFSRIFLKKSDALLVRRSICRFSTGN